MCILLIYYVVFEIELNENPNSFFKFLPTPPSYLQIGFNLSSRPSLEEEALKLYRNQCRNYIMLTENIKCSRKWLSHEK